MIFSTELDSLTRYRLNIGYPSELSNILEFYMQAAAKSNIESRLVKDIF